MEETIEREEIPQAQPENCPPEPLEQVDEEPVGEVMEEESPKKRRKLYAEHILAIIALVSALLLGVMVLVCMPYFGQEEEDPQLIIHRQPTEATLPPVTEDPTAPTMPQPEKNPYGKLDFQYEGRYLGCIKADTIPGVDVSKYQGNIDWEAVAESGIRFAIIRVGYRGYGEAGKLADDDTFTRNIRGALAAGLDVGVYFFSQAITPEEAVEEAEFVLERIRSYDITMPVVYDWEYVSDTARTANMDRRTLTDCYLAFCQKIAEAGYTPMPYFNTFQSRDLMNLYELEEYPFWLALYSDRMTFPYAIEMWQYTCTGKVPGIKGDVDINLYFTED